MKKYQILFLLCLLPLFAQAEPVKFNGLYYNLKGAEAEVTSEPGGFMPPMPYSFDYVEIPDYIYYSGLTYKVTSIGNYAFRESSLSSVTIPNSVTSIGNYAFRDCSGLKSVTLPSSVTFIGEGAFSGCIFLTSVTALMPNPVEINKNVFSNRTNATLYVPKGSKSAYQKAAYWKDFGSIVEITNINFADENVKALCVANWDTDQNGKLSYEEAAAVKDLQKVFTCNSDITSFDELQYFTGLTSIGVQAFYNCTGLTSVTIPNSVTVLDDYSFYNCSMTSVTIPNSVTTINKGAFWSCGLTSVNIPNSVTSIGQNAL